MAKATQVRLDTSQLPIQSTGCDDVFALYDALLGTRDRLAGLPPLTRQDVQAITLALHEVVWFCLTPAHAKTLEHAAPKTADAEFVQAARDRSGDLYTTIVAAVAIKLAGPRVGLTPTAILDGLTDHLDALTFDLRSTKRATLGLLARARKEVDDRLAFVRARRPGGFQFAKPPELYRNRSEKKETPDRFLKRVYGADVRRGLTQADIRRADPAFYNVLHVWAARHKRLLSRLVPASRTRTK